ncbi:DUF3445 domain-containing protein [Pleurocapsales cyanobacterium LEGE 06147]|nr:DUF3445 domain-containing protein [Pleurocapsales cyanobacterium LEGE 06147]
MGLKPLKWQDWIEIDDQFVAYLTRKQELFQDRYPEVFASLSSSEAGQKEVLDLLLDYLPQRFPQYYQRRGDRIENILMQQFWNISDFEAKPLDLAGRLVQEDLCLMRSSPDGYILIAASVCFPSNWRLEDKLGQPLDQIHKPVPQYTEKLEDSTNNFFDHLKVDCPVYRLNWTIVDTSELSLRGSKSFSQLDEITVENAGEKLWIRVERQTLRRLEKSNHVLFTIRTYLYPLSIVESNPAIAQNLSTAIQQMPSEIQRYKHLLAIRKILLDYLNSNLS